MAANIKKTVCPVTREEFRENAKPATVKIGENNLDVAAKEFSTGSLGWYHSSKINMRVGDKVVTVQVGLNLTIVGSKELPADTPAEAATV